MINQRFLSILASAPPIFCIFQAPSKFYLKRALSYKPSIDCIRFKFTLQLPNEANANLVVLDKLMYEIKKFELVDNPETRDWPRLPCRYFDLCDGTSTGGYVLQCQHTENFGANNLVLLQSSCFVWQLLVLAASSTPLTFDRGLIHLQRLQITSNLRLRYSSPEYLAKRVRSGRTCPRNHGSKPSHSKKRLEVLSGKGAI